MTCASLLKWNHVQYICIFFILYLIFHICVSHKWEKQAKVKKAPIISTVSTNLVRVHFISFIRLALLPLWNGSRTSECKHLYSYQYIRYHSVSKVFLWPSICLFWESFITLNIGKGSYDYLWPWYSLGKSQNTWEA